MTFLGGEKSPPAPAFFDTFASLAAELDAIRTQLPPLNDPSGLDRLEHLSHVNPHIGSAYLSYHGAVVILFSLAIGVSNRSAKDGVPGAGRTKKDDLIAYEKVFDSALRLAELGKRMRGTKGLTAIQCLLESAVSGC